MELQCKERVDLLDALQKSRKEAKTKGKGSDGSSTKGKTLATSKAESSVPPSPSPGWLGNGTVPPVSYPDLSRPTPPPLPTRPPPPPKKESELLLERPSSISQAPPAQLPPPYSTPNLPVPPKKTSRTPSPDKKGGHVMLTTLRGPKDARKQSKSPKVSSARFPGAPPASSKAAGLAWDSSSKSFVPRAGQLSAGRDMGSTDPSTSRHNSLGGVGGTAPSRPESTVATDSDEPGLFGSYRMRPADQTPSEVEPTRKFSFEKGAQGGKSAASNTATQVPDLISLDPPTPPVHDQALPDKLAPGGRNKSPIRTKPPVDYPSYRTEFPPTAPSSKATAEFLARKAVRDDPSRDAAPLAQQSSPQRTMKPPPPNGLSRRPMANSSTPRTNRGVKNMQIKQDSAESNEDTSSSSHEMLQKKKKNPQKARGPAIPANPAQEDTPKSDEDSQKETDAPQTWKERLKYVKKNLPKGVDEQAAKQIFNEIVVQGDEVHWADVAGLEVAKKALKEAVVYPFLRPDLFMGLREPARGMLLFGPPGTGKTMLARAVATESRSTFFAISASSLTSKWLGESEKLVRALFTLAKALAPSIIFVDEIDSLLSSRGGSNEHESTRRIKTEFLIQWSDLQRAAAGRQQSEKEKAEGDASRVLVLAATNMPWAIDEAARRRFVRRQYIPLPEAHVRSEQLRTLLGHQKHKLNKKDIQVLVELTDGKLCFCL